MKGSFGVSADSCLVSRLIWEVQFLQTTPADSTVRHCRDTRIFNVLHHPRRRRRRRHLASRHLLPVLRAKQRRSRVRRKLSACDSIGRSNRCKRSSMCDAAGVFFFPIRSQSINDDVRLSSLLLLGATGSCNQSLIAPAGHQIGAHHSERESLGVMLRRQ